MNVGLVFLIQIIVTVLFVILASIFDIKRNIVPDWLNFSLISFGLISNLILTFVTSNVKYILSSFILMVVTFYITKMLWKLKMWGGGDVKLFTSIATAIPIGLNVDFLNIFPTFSVYPFVFTVIVNSILVSFPFLVIFTAHLIIKNNLVKRHADLFVNVLNYEGIRTLIKSSLNRTVPVKDLKEGMIVNRYSFDDEHICELIAEHDSNLKVYKSSGDGYKYYFKSQTAGGITSEDVTLLKVMSAQDFISEYLCVKIAFPFTPAILFGLMIALSYGDLVMIFTKNFFLVI
ncbi:prepilin peptidase [Methanobrevibacter sp.]|uniref:prepilin peptidase n=1 Tax=Methanobrevibacter sp. TaxID=66852 RepID=UPI003890B0D5